MAHRPRPIIKQCAAVVQTLEPGRSLRALALGLAGAMMLGACAQVGQDSSPVASLLGTSPIQTGSTEPDPNPDPKAELNKATLYWGKEYAKDPRNPDNAVAYARNLKAMGQRDQALSVLQGASLYNSDHKGLASEYGRLALELDQVGMAEKLLARAEDPMKPDWKLVSAQGAVLSKQGRNKESIPYFERAMALSPNNSAVMNNLAMAHAMNGNATKAEEILRAAMQQPNASPRVRQNLALVLGLQGKFDEARQMASTDLPPEKAQAAIAYLEKMVDAAQASPAFVTSVTPAKPPMKEAAVRRASIKGATPQASVPKAQANPVETNRPEGPLTWSTEVSATDQPIVMAPATGRR